MEAKDYNCPSYFPSRKASAIGMVNKKGTVDFFEKPLSVDEEFIQEVQTNKDLELKFRFSGPCINQSCKQWADNKCGLINELEKLLENIPKKSTVSHCPINKDCRWRLQEGEKACLTCVMVNRNGYYSEKEDVI